MNCLKSRIARNHGCGLVLLSSRVERNIKLKPYVSIDIEKT